MQFKPNFDLLIESSKAERFDFDGCLDTRVAVFRHGGKTLVYMCDRHTRNVSFDMVDMCFSSGVVPEILVIEMENTGAEYKFSNKFLQHFAIPYAAVRAQQHGCPVVFADLSKEEMLNVLRNGFPDVKITESTLDKVLSVEPNQKGGSLEQMATYLYLMGRDRFMLQNIATALNKYDTVFVIMGWWHFISQRLALEDMMGKPEYITKIKNMRGDFSDVKIEPIKLCEFEMVKDDNKS